jgi:hypothetical protein
MWVPQRDHFKWLREGMVLSRNGMDDDLGSRRRP